ncbi:DUF2892 domain-containing protein [Methylobacterium currus]|jgi:hypothetical protein|uniref:YgaP family membrane protein n=1 Tax=Methylobacterium currus TaxID=2051553 RepID=UPI002F2619D5
MTMTRDKFFQPRFRRARQRRALSSSRWSVAMIANIGTIDRSLRIVLGLALLISAYDVLTGVWVWLAAAIGAVLMVTALIGTCPAYSLLGISTCPDRLRGA